MEVVIGFIIGVVLACVIGFILIKYLSKVQRNQFELMANEILSKNTSSLKENASDNLSSIVSPLNEKIKEYKDQMDQMHKFDLKERESLREKLNQMISSAGRIETEANQLSQALSSDVKFQGDWGEIVLENVLELAGLEKGREFEVQNVLKDDNDKVYRPDAIIKLPNDSQIIIDSKVSLKAYFDYMNTDEKERALKDLKISIQNHIDSLSKKNYQLLNGVNAPDFVYLFIPVEGVYSLIIREYPNIIDESLKKNIILVSPVNLIANLKTVASLWRLEKQSKNAQLMAQKAGAMHDKFVMVLDDIAKMGSALEKASSIQSDLIKKISSGKGSLVSRSQELKVLGAKTSKSIDPSYTENIDT
jgi:DNA recombination protein RmuC